MENILLVNFTIKFLSVLVGILLCGFGFVLAIKSRKLQKLILAFTLFSVGLLLILFSLGLLIFFWR